MEGTKGERLSREKNSRGSSNRAANEGLWVGKDEEEDRGRDPRWMTFDQNDDDDDDEENGRDGRVSPAGQDFSWVGISTFEPGYGASSTRTTRLHGKHDKGTRASISPEDNNNEGRMGASTHRRTRHHRHSNGGNTRRRVVIAPAEDDGSDVVGSDYEEQQHYSLSGDPSEVSSSMVGLHRQKALSTAQNEQLQKEVDALQVSRVGLPEL